MQLEEVAYLAAYGRFAGKHLGKQALVEFVVELGYARGRVASCHLDPARRGHQMCVFTARALGREPRCLVEQMW